MPDTETLDRVLDIITRVPHLHNQHVVAGPVQDPAAARAELAKAPDLQSLIAPQDRAGAWPTRACGSAFCVGGWALMLKGCTLEFWEFYAPGVAPDLEGLRALADPLGAAADWLDIDLHVEVDGDVIGPSIFEASATLPQIRAWVAYYKGEISAPDLKVLLELHDEDDEDFFLEATSE